ncbi:MAG: glycosyltransferase family 4 protein [Paludibacter sp.]|nr:glycosyltransferase family 4 protein [Paludibacter sp.]
MKIVHINFWDKLGGAAIASNRLHKTMINMGINSKMIVFDKLIKDDKTVFAIDSFFNKIINSIYNIIDSRRLKKFRPFVGNFSIGTLGKDVSKLEIIKEADVIYIHWINNNFLSISSINKLLNLNKPVIWFLHDMWPFTGGCHHSFECIKYQTQCESCDLLKSKNAKDISFKDLNLKIKKIGLPHTNLHIVSPSNWLAECAKKSVVFSKNKISVIPNLIDINKYKPINKEYARKILNLPCDGKIILFGADMGLNNPYKGWSYLKEALMRIDFPFSILTFGGESQENSLNDFPFIIYNQGRLFDDYSLMLLYNACDVFVIPSLAEAFGQTALEATSCGTPVVGFNVGGIPDIIQHKKNGYLAKYRDAVDLQAGIEWVLNNTRYDELCKDCRDFAVKTFSSEKVVKQHIEVISTLILS